MLSHFISCSKLFVIASKYFNHIKAGARKQRMRQDNSWAQGNSNEVKIFIDQALQQLLWIISLLIKYLLEWLSKKSRIPVNHVRFHSQYILFQIHVYYTIILKKYNFEAQSRPENQCVIKAAKEQFFIETRFTIN